MNGKKIVLDAWFSPDDKEELWKWAAESGLTEMTIFPANEETPEYLVKSLGYCKKYGLTAKLLLAGREEYWKGVRWEELLKGYEDVVSGFDLYDEPVVDREIAIASYGVNSRTCFADLVPLVGYVSKTFPTKNICSTIFPNYGTNPILGIPDDQTYDDYVKAFCDTVLSAFPEGKQKWLGTDFYPYYLDRFDGGLLRNLEDLQYYAKPLGAHLFLYIQTMGSKHLLWRCPNREEIALQYNVALAYGVKCISMFCYQQPPCSHLFGYADGAAMITDGYSPREDGTQGVYERTQVYYDVQALNRELEPYSEELASAEWQGVLCVKGTMRSDRDDFSPLKYTLPSYEGIESVSATENLLVGCFKQGEQDEYMLVNYSDPLHFANSEVTLTFKDADEAVVYQGGEKRTVRLDGGRYQTNLTGGEGVFVVPVKNKRR